MSAGSLVLAPMVALFAIPYAVEAIKTVPDALQTHSQYYLLSLIFIVLTLLWAAALCGLTVWLGRQAYRFILSVVQSDREAAFALVGIGLATASVTSLELPSFFAEYLTTPTYNFGLLWIPASLLILASLCAFVRARAFAWYSICLLPLIPFVMVSLHENIWYLPRSCPAFWLRSFQGPWATVGFSIMYAAVLAIAAQAWQKEDVEVKKSSITLTSIVVVIFFIELLGANRIDWFHQPWIVFAFLTASVGLLAVVVRVWRRETVSANRSALAAAVTLPVVLLLVFLILADSQRAGASECGPSLKAVRHIVGPFYW